MSLNQLLDRGQEFPQSWAKLYVKSMKYDSLVRQSLPYESTHIVHIDVETGSDDNNGTSGNPVKTFLRAVELMKKERGNEAIFKLDGSVSGKCQISQAVSGHAPYDHLIDFRDLAASYNKIIIQGNPQNVKDYGAGQITSTVAPYASWERITNLIVPSTNRICVKRADNEKYIAVETADSSSISLVGGTGTGAAGFRSFTIDGNEVLISGQVALLSLIPVEFKELFIVLGQSHTLHNLTPFKCVLKGCFLDYSDVGGNPDSHALEGHFRLEGCRIQCENTSPTVFSNYKSLLEMESVRTNTALMLLQQRAEWEDIDFVNSTLIVDSATAILKRCKFTNFNDLENCQLLNADVEFVNTEMDLKVDSDNRYQIDAEASKAYFRNLRCNRSLNDGPCMFLKDGSDFILDGSQDNHMKDGINIRLRTSKCVVTNTTIDLQTFKNDGTDPNVVCDVLGEYVDEALGDILRTYQTSGQFNFNLEAESRLLIRGNPTLINPIEASDPGPIVASHIQMDRFSEASIPKFPPLGGGNRVWIQMGTAYGPQNAPDVPHETRVDNRHYHIIPYDRSNPDVYHGCTVYIWSSP